MQCLESENSEHSVLSRMSSSKPSSLGSVYYVEEKTEKRALRASGGGRYQGISAFQTKQD